MAKVTAGDIITEARGLLNDASAVRWTNAALFRYIFAGENQMAGNHPETQLSDDDTKIDYPTPTLLTQVTDYTTISVEHAKPLVHFVVAQAFLEDADDAGNLKLADYHLSLYRQFLGDVQVR